MLCPKLRKTIADFSPRAASIATAGTMKANQQGGSLQYSSSIVLLFCKEDVCVFISRLLLISSDGQLRGMVLACLILGCHGIFWPIIPLEISHT